MKSLISLLALSTLAASSTVQRPLQDASSSEAVASSKSLPLVNSTQLQGHIHSDNLLKRAKELYKIAELGTKEYGHPTRVIGSEGTIIYNPFVV
jgi:aminopeptidase Y